MKPMGLLVILTRLQERKLVSESFSYVLNWLKSGKKAQRSGWNGKGMWIAIAQPDGFPKMTLPYIYMKTADGHKVPWLASQTDLLSDDWNIYE